MRQLMMNSILHVADISNPCRPWALCKKWSDLVVEEFFLQVRLRPSFVLQDMPTGTDAAVMGVDGPPTAAAVQGDLEKLNRLPQSPNMNREIHNQPQISVGFIDFVVKPFVDSLAHYIPGCDVLMTKLVENRAVRHRMRPSLLSFLSGI